MILPDDLVATLTIDERARLRLEGFLPSGKSMILYWITSAKRAETGAGAPISHGRRRRPYSPRL
jgi:uncharacterized protein YdeI (YjbR/CyaY-like superfamily)